MKTKKKRTEVSFGYYRIGNDFLEFKDVSFDDDSRALRMQIANLRRSAKKLRSIAGQLDGSVGSITCDETTASIFLESQKALEMCELELVKPPKRIVKLQNTFDEIKKLTGDIIHD
jgi:hypothetical protein